MWRSVLNFTLTSNLIVGGQTFFFSSKRFLFVVVLILNDPYNTRAYTLTHIIYILYSVSAIIWSGTCLIQLNGEIIVDACTRGCRNIRKACTPVVLKIEDLIRNYLGLSRFEDWWWITPIICLGLSEPSCECLCKSPLHRLLLIGFYDEDVSKPLEQCELREGIGKNVYFNMYDVWYQTGDRIATTCCSTDGNDS